MEPEIQYDCDLGGDLVEGFFFIDEVSAYLALQSGIPEATIRARIIEAFGYCQRPPKSGEKVIMLDSRFYSLDEQAIRAMKKVIFNFVAAPEIDAITRAYLAEPNGDAYRICTDFFDCEVHHYIIIAVLDVLQDRGQLPRHESWG